MVPARLAIPSIRVRSSDPVTLGVQTQSPPPPLPTPSSAASWTPPEKSSPTGSALPSRSTAAPPHPSSAMPASPLARPSPGGAGASSASNSPDPGAEVPVRKSALRAQQARVRRARVCGSARAVPSWPGRFPRQVHPQGPARTPGTASGPGAAYPVCCGSASACGARLPGTDLSR